jgi:hypothetical protein
MFLTIQKKPSYFEEKKRNFVSRKRSSFNANWGLQTNNTRKILAASSRKSRHLDETFFNHGEYLDTSDEGNV